MKSEKCSSLKYPFNQNEYGLINIKDMEKLTGYSFLSSIPTVIQEAIENRDVNDILTEINFIQPASFMVEADDELKFPKKGTAFDSTIGHSGIVNKITITPNNVWSDSSRSEVSFNQNSELETINASLTEVSMNSAHMTQVSSPQIGLSQITPTQVGRIQISVSGNSAFQPSKFQKSTKQVGSSQIGSSQISLSQVRSTQVNVWQNSPSEVNHAIFRFLAGLDQLNPGEISLSISIPNQQLLGSNFPTHNLTSNALTNLKYSATNIWSDLFKPDKPLDTIRINPRAARLTC